MAALIVAAGYRKHGRAGPTLLAAAGATLVVWVMLIAYSGLIEAAGFALLAAGVVLDHRIRRYSGSPRAHRPAAAGVGDRPARVTSRPERCNSTRRET